MSSFIIVELDTKSPEIEIYAPSYTTSNISNRIIVKSDEKLSEFQNIYVVDSANNKYYYTFEKTDDNTLTGIITFNNTSLGVATIHVQVEDEVSNRSKIFCKRINIKDSLNLLLLEIEDSVAKIDDESFTQYISTGELTRTIKTERGIIND